MLEGVKQCQKMLFLARRVTTNEIILVKFTDQYGKGVHELLASHNMAPALFDVRYETGLVMVVMEYLTETRMWTDQDKSNKRLIEQVTSVMSLLKTNSIVHGDLRSPNVHVKADRLYILDFDWAGPAGEAVYPDMLNESEEWPKSASIRAKITHNHDKFMLEKLCGSLNGESI